MPSFSIVKVVSMRVYPSISRRNSAAISPCHYSGQAQQARDAPSLAPVRSMWENDFAE
jgi:hypothetical protein